LKACGFERSILILQASYKRALFVRFINSVMTKKNAPSKKSISKKTKSHPVLYEVRSSSIHRRGVFASTDIKKDDRILEYKGEKISKAESNRRGNVREESARKSGHARVFIFELNKRQDLDGSIPNNPAKYINHSCEANCEAVNIHGKIWIMALRDIAQGEELSFDYGYDSSHFMDHPCYCNTPSCIGYIVRKDQRRKVKALLTKRTIAKQAKKTAPAGLPHINFSRAKREALKSEKKDISF
jgi:uncharacterized protein